MVPRSEYPRPQLIRDSWMNLNGKWQFEFDFGLSGQERGMCAEDSGHLYSKEITVPFCPESKLSGIEYKDFMNSVWYRRAVNIPAQWDTSKGYVILHFGAVDWQADVWVNGRLSGSHQGGYTSFSIDITNKVRTGENIIIVRATDDKAAHGRQASGKQSHRYGSYGCMYTRTTGIWQTVWMEYVPDVYVTKLDITPDVKNNKVDISAVLYGNMNGDNDYRLEASASYEGKPMGKKTIIPSWRGNNISIELNELHLWEPLCGRLYDLDVKLYKGDKVVDSVTSYFGMRSVDLTDNVILINGKPVYQRLVLDQGFYPDGIYTAPSDDELRLDIQRAIDMGFNGARLHEKVFEERFLYWADKAGYLCWGEHANWGLDISRDDNLGSFQNEWMEEINRDYSHPSIVGWCPFNETQGNQSNRLVATIVKLTKQLDPTRPVIDTSGWTHHFASDGRSCTDIFDVHDYEQNPDKFKATYTPFAEGHTPPPTTRTPVDTWTPGVPYFVSEFGGIRWAPEKGNESWGYGVAPEDEEAFINRYRGLVTALLEHPKMCAFCYTQLTDVEQEVNGLYTYDRRPKFDAAVIKAITSQPAAIEKIGE